MSTPMETSSWKVHAWKKGAAIYLKTVTENRVFDAATEVEKTKHSFLNMAFKRMLTISAANPSSKLMNEAEKFLKITRTSFGQHNLISLSEVLALDANEDEVAVCLTKAIKQKDFKVNFYNEQYFSLWSKAQLTNQRNIIIGKYNSNLLLESVNAVEANTANMMQVMKHNLILLETTAKVWDPDHACGFLNRFLVFVRSSLSNDLLPDGRLISLEYVKKMTKVMTPVVVPVTNDFDFE